MSKMKNTLGGINNRLVITEKEISELKDLATEMLQSETERKRPKKSKRHQ